MSKQPKPETMLEGIARAQQNIGARALAAGFVPVAIVVGPRFMRDMPEDARAELTTARVEVLISNNCPEKIVFGCVTRALAHALLAALDKKDWVKVHALMVEQEVGSANN